jgi:hypothetical protein
MEGFSGNGETIFSIQHSAFIIGFSIWPSVSTFVKIASLSKSYAYESITSYFLLFLGYKKYDV